MSRISPDSITSPELARMLRKRRLVAFAASVVTSFALIAMLISCFYLPNGGYNAMYLMPVIFTMPLPVLALVDRALDAYAFW